VVQCHHGMMRSCLHFTVPEYMQHCFALCPSPAGQWREPAATQSPTQSHCQVGLSQCGH